MTINNLTTSSKLRLPFVIMDLSAVTNGQTQLSNHAHCRNWLSSQEPASLKEYLYWDSSVLAGLLLGSFEGLSWVSWASSNTNQAANLELRITLRGNPLLSSLKGLSWVSWDSSNTNQATNLKLRITLRGNPLLSSFKWLIWVSRAHSNIKWWTNLELRVTLIGNLHLSSSEGLSCVSRVLNYIPYRAQARANLELGSTNCHSGQSKVKKEFHDENVKVGQNRARGQIKWKCCSWLRWCDLFLEGRQLVDLYLTSVYTTIPNSTWSPKKAKRKQLAEQVERNNLDKTYVHGYIRYASCTEPKQRGLAKSNMDDLVSRCAAEMQDVHGYTTLQLPHLYEHSVVPHRSVSCRSSLWRLNNGAKSVCGQEK